MWFCTSAHKANVVNFTALLITDHCHYTGSKQSTDANWSSRPGYSTECAEVLWGLPGSEWIKSNVEHPAEGYDTARSWLRNSSRLLRALSAASQVCCAVVIVKEKVKTSICVARIMYKAPLTRIYVTETEPQGCYLGHRSACKHSPLQWPNNRPQAAPASSRSPPS